MIRLVKILLLLLVLVAAQEDCGTPGECANPDVEGAPAKGEVAADLGEQQQQQVIESTQQEKVEEDPKCPSRPHIIRCTAEYLDVNKNNKLDRIELEEAINKLPWLARGVLKIIGSVNSIMKKCDVDQDDAISMDHDMEHNQETCLATCFKRRAFKSAFFPACDL
jgi:hypothetical protein